LNNWQAIKKRNKNFFIIDSNKNIITTRKKYRKYLKII
jgi:hypothetical protein